MRYVNLIGFICAFIAAYMSYDIGNDWLELGYGLHPYIAFPIALVMVAAGLLQLVWFLEHLLPEDMEDEHFTRLFGEKR